jgi:hypothetical protein
MKLDDIKTGNFIRNEHSKRLIKLEGKFMNGR